MKKNRKDIFRKAIADNLNQKAEEASELGDFVSDVAQMSRIVTLNDMAIEAGKDGALKFDATAVTYRYLDEEEVAKARKDKSKDKAGK
mgnify:CR=1 FL=1